MDVAKTIAAPARRSHHALEPRALRSFAQRFHPPRIIEEKKTLKPETHTVVVPWPASTLILLRDTSGGPGVLMLKRHGLSDVLGEAYVFPGGKLDSADLALSTADFLDESPISLQARLAEPDCDTATAAALFVAAIREAFEECAILIGEGDAGSAGERMTPHVRAGMSFGRALGELGIRLGASELRPWSRWITPVSSLQAKRFDTRFFVARSPRGALARHDGHEATETAWMRPRQALERYWAGDIALAPPQIMTLGHFTRHDSVAGILNEAERRPPVLVQPEVLATAAGLMLCYPGDPAHPVRERAMPGPLRVAVRNGRYEPEEGFEAFFA